MERKDQTIIFNASEQTEFGVQAAASVPSALHTASVFGELSDRMSERCIANQEATDPQDIQDLKELERRAMRLRSFSDQIMKHCPVEVIQNILDGIPGIKR